MNENNVDSSQEVVYNKGNALDDFVVKMDEQRPINNTECKHEVLIPDPTDTIGTAIYHGCATYKCGVGFYIQPAKNKNIT